MTALAVFTIGETSLSRAATSEQSQNSAVGQVSEHPDSPAPERGALMPEAHQVTYVIDHRSRTEAAAQQLPHTREHLLPRLAKRPEYPLRCIMGSRVIFTRFVISSESS